MTFGESCAPVRLCLVKLDDDTPRRTVPEPARRPVGAEVTMAEAIAGLSIARRQFETRARQIVPMLNRAFLVNQASRQFAVLCRGAYEGIPRSRMFMRNKDYAASVTAADLAVDELLEGGDWDQIFGLEVRDTADTIEGLRNALSRLADAVLEVHARAWLVIASADIVTHFPSGDDRGPSQLKTATTRMTTGPPATSPVLQSADTAGVRAA